MEIPAHEFILRIGSPSVIEWRSKGVITRRNSRLEVYRCFRPDCDKLREYFQPCRALGPSCNLKANVHAESMQRETVSRAQQRPHDSISTHMTYIIWPVHLDMEPIRIVELERFL
jgi:hypothetical protein